MPHILVNHATNSTFSITLAIRVKWFSSKPLFLNTKSWIKQDYHGVMCKPSPCNHTVIPDALHPVHQSCEKYHDVQDVVMFEQSLEAIQVTMLHSNMLFVQALLPAMPSFIFMVTKITASGHYQVVCQCKSWGYYYYKCMLLFWDNS